MKYLQVKVCGITRVVDAKAAVKHGADMLGFIFYNKSPRSITVEQAKIIISKIESTVIRVGVFVNENTEKIIRIAQQLQLDMVQLSGNEKSRDIKKIRKAGFEVIKTVHIDWSNGKITKKLPEADIIQFDSSDKNQYGGTGKQFEWNKKIPKVNNLMLSGGLNSGNVLEGIRKFRPLIVDVNSGVEIKPGIKSSHKIATFMRICNNYRYGK